MSRSGTDVVELARRWIAADPDPATRAELQRLLDDGDTDALAERVAGTLTFGTAGIRGVVGAGPLRMNRAVVIRTTRGLADHLRDLHPSDVAPVVVGFDARPDSERFARDTVAVLAAARVPVRWFASPVPTPLVAFHALEVGASAAVVVTASHNPPEYNGYKVYSGNGAQIVPPEDQAIAAAIDAVGPADEVPHLGDAIARSDLVEAVDVDDALRRYLTAVDQVRPAVARDTTLRIVHTPLHGVGGGPVREALAHAGYADVAQVPEQVEPDGRFPTVRFPNPEEEGALDLATALAVARDADVLLANDPDVDRLAVGLPGGDGYSLLTGNQIGALLGDFVLANVGPGPTPLVVSSIVSSPMLGAVAATYGARAEVTLTGFKWICNAALDLERDEDVRFVFGFEEALGYTVGRTVRDKDGIAAAVVFADLAASLRVAGRTVAQHLDDLYRQHGLWVSEQHGVVRPGLEGREEIAAAMARIGEHRAPTELAGRTVTGLRDFRTGADQRPRWLPASDLVELALGGGSRALIRPSGTEPKVKIYVDLVREVQDVADLRAEEARLRREAAQVARDLASFVGLSDGPS